MTASQCLTPFTDLSICELGPEHFKQVVDLGNRIHGTNYLQLDQMEDILHKSKKDSTSGSPVNCSLVITPKDDPSRVVGFRLTYAPGKWEVGRGCTPALWPYPQSEVCYLKSNTLDPEFQGRGVGGLLLRLSLDKARMAGALGGVAHIWLQSPNNKAFRYFSKAGGKVVKIHKEFWYEYSLDTGYVCTVDGYPCRCSAAEMLIRISRR